MGRVLPFIFVSLGLVVAAVYQAHSERQQARTVALSFGDEIVIELLDNPDTP